MVKVDYSQCGQTGQHSEKKYCSLNLLLLVQGLCHPPTTLCTTHVVT